MLKRIWWVALILLAYALLIVSVAIAKGHKSTKSSDGTVKSVVKVQTAKEPNPRFEIRESTIERDGMKIYVLVDRRSGEEFLLVRDDKSMAMSPIIVY